MADELLVERQELTGDDADIAEIIRSHDRPIKQLIKSDVKVKAIKAQDAVPPLVARVPKSKSDEQWIYHDDFHVGQELYVEDCPYCRKDPRFMHRDSRPNRFVFSPGFFGQ